MLFICSAHACKCRAQYDVLFIPQLVTSCHIFLSHFCDSSSSSCCCYPCSFFSLAVTKNRWSFAFFWDSWNKKRSKYLGFLRPRSSTAWYLRCFLASGSKFHGIYSVFLASDKQKHWYLRSFQHVARSSSPMPKAQTRCTLQCFGSWHASKKSKSPPNSAQNDLQKNKILSSFFPTPDPP